MTSSAWTRRDFIRRTATAGGLAVGGSFLLGACGGGEGVPVGIANEAPYGFENAEGVVTGEAPEVARAILGNLGMGEIQAQAVDFGSLIPGLNANRFRIVCAGMFITPERCGQAAFSIPDYTAKEAFLVPTGNPKGVTSYEDVAQQNLQVAVLGAAVERDYAIQSGVPEGNIQVFPTQDALLQAVTDDRVYCASLTDISLNWLVRNNPDAPVEVTESFTPMIDGEEITTAGGFVFRADDNELREAFNGELRTLHGNGRWLEIVRPFGFGEANIPPESLTTEQLCSEV